MGAQQRKLLHQQRREAGGGHRRGEPGDCQHQGRRAGDEPRAFPGREEGGRVPQAEPAQRVQAPPRDLPSLGPLRRGGPDPALQRQPHHRETGRRLLDADAPPPRRALGHSRRHRPGDGQRQAVPADREPVHLYSDWRRAQPGKPGPHSAGSAGDPVGVVPRRGRHYSY